jgi:hypothetical protein
MTLHGLDSTRKVRIATEHFSAAAAMGLTSRVGLGMKAASYCPVAWSFRRSRHKDPGGRHEHPFHQTQKVRRHGRRVGPQGPWHGCRQCPTGAPRGGAFIDDPLVGPARRPCRLDRASGGARRHPGPLDVRTWACRLGPGGWPQRIRSQHVAFGLRVHRPCPLITPWDAWIGCPLTRCPATFEKLSASERISFPFPFPSSSAS